MWAVSTDIRALALNLPPNPSTRPPRPQKAARVHVLLAIFFPPCLQLSFEHHDDPRLLLTVGEGVGEMGGGGFILTNLQITRCHGTKAPKERRIAHYAGAAFLSCPPAQRRSAKFPFSREISHVPGESARLGEPMPSRLSTSASPHSRLFSLKRSEPLASRGTCKSCLIFFISRSPSFSCSSFLSPNQRKARGR